MRGVVYSDYSKMITDLKSTKSLNNFVSEKQGDGSNYFERDPNEIPYTNYISHPDEKKWAIICDDNGAVESLLGFASELTEDWNTINILFV